VRASADSGSIRVKLAAGGYRLRLVTDSGHLEVPEQAHAWRSPNEIEGPIEGGGPMVDLKTDSGSIEVS